MKLIFILPDRVNLPIKLPFTVSKTHFIDLFAVYSLCTCCAIVVHLLCYYSTTSAQQIQRCCTNDMILTEAVLVAEAENFSLI
jgi:hypothetical protein